MNIDRLMADIKKLGNIGYEEGWHILRLFSKAGISLNF